MYFATLLGFFFVCVCVGGGGGGGGGAANTSQFSLFWDEGNVAIITQNSFHVGHCNLP